MKKSLSHFPEDKVEELGLITEIIREELTDVHMIILFGSYARGKWVDDMYTEGHITYEYKSDYDILIITEFKENAKSSALHNKVEKRLNRELRTTVNPIFHPIAQVNSLLSEGQYFFSDIRKEGIMLYDSGKFKLKRRKRLDVKQRKQIAKQDFKKWFKNAKDFYIQHEFALKRRRYKLAAFELHQSTECFYHAILLVFTGYKSRFHDIEKFGKKAAGYDPEFKKVFPRATKKEERLFKLLKKAYVDARYKDTYKITKKELEYLGQRVKKLEGLAKRICKERIESFA